MTRGGMAALALVVMAGGCNLPPTACGGDSLTPGTQGGSATVATTGNGLDIQFGSVAIGQSSEEFFYLQEACAPVAISTVTLTGSSDFSLVLAADAGELSYPLGYPYGLQSVDAVAFRPSGVGSASATVTFRTNSRQTPTIVFTLEADGVAPGPSCGTDADCDGGGFCDGRYCQPNACQYGSGPGSLFDNVPTWDAGPACAPESRACPGSSGLVLTDTLSDPGNCGGCGHACSAGQGCGGGHCGVCAGYRIGPEQDFPLGLQSALGAHLVHALTLGDFDGDGHPDALVAADLGAPGNAWLVINDGKGGFASVPRMLDVCGYPFSIADFNGDCALDVLAGTTGVLINDGHGNFPVRNELQASSDYSSLAIDALADFNQDGTPDLLGSSGLLLGDGRGGFHPSPFQTALFSSSSALAAGDFSGNGRPDVIGYEATPNATLLYYYNDGGEDLVFETDYFPASNETLEPVALVAAPLTGGVPSLVYGLQGAVVALPDPAVGAGGGALLLLDGGYQAFALASADMDLDGHADVIAAGPQPDAGFLDVWSGFAVDAGQLSAGRFQTVSTRYVAGFLAVADVNGDGIPDIVAATPSRAADPGTDGPPTLMVFLGSCP